MRRLLPLALLLTACASQPRDPWPDAPGDTRDPELAALCSEAWERRLELAPVEATYLGDMRFAGELPPPSPRRRAAERAVWAELLQRLEAIDPARLDADDALTHRLLQDEWRLRIRELDLAYDPGSWNLDTQRGPQVGLLSLAADQPCRTPRERALLLERWAAMPACLDQHTANLRRGLREGRVASRTAAEKVLAQLDALLAQAPEATPLVAALPPEALAEDGFRARVVALVGEEILPAFARYRAAIAGEVLPCVRGDGRAGVLHVPGGEEAYRALIEKHTSLDLDPLAIHRIGLEEVARIRAETAELGARLFGTRDVAAIQRRLREDPALHFSSREEVEAKAREALARAEAAVPAAFGRLPRAPCEVVRVPAHEERDTTIAYYREPAPDGSRPGRYYINTHAPATRTRYEAEALAWHEAVPGHHLQIALHQELAGLPLVRRHADRTAFIEGWALYTERLADELGLYSGDLDRMGMLSFDAWRACRLVVDTGIHALGWSRDQAIDYMLANTLLAPNNVANEVDRYIGWPGQALAYKLGQLEILALRAEAEERLGPDFALADFHDELLRHGPLTLAALREQVQRWIGERESARGPARAAG